MRVAYVSSHAGFVGGGEYSLFDLMTHLPADVEPVLLVPSAGALSSAAEQEGIEWHAVAMPPIGVASLPALWRWRRLIRDIRPDILHANNSRAAFYAGLTGKIMQIPVLFHCRVNRPDPWMDGMLVRLVRGVIVNSHATARRFEPWPDLSARVVHNGVDLPVGEKGAMGSHPFGAEHILLVVARISRWKRHDIALDVFERLSDRFPGLHLLCIGGKDESEWWEEMQKRTRVSGKEDCIHWLGEVERSEMGKWYASADVLLLPSDDEPFGRVLVEGMAMGVPVVAFNAGGVSEVIRHEHEGLLVSPGDVESMTAAVARLLDDEALCVSMGKAGRKRARLFSVQEHISRICGIYEEVRA
ncbi:MAG: glycosyltransferase family 4 protein [Mariprofundaceae bacterium]